MKDKHRLNHSYSRQGTWKAHNYSPGERLSNINELSLRTGSLIVSIGVQNDHLYLEIGQNANISDNLSHYHNIDPSLHSRVIFDTTRSMFCTHTPNPTSHTAHRTPQTLHPTPLIPHSTPHILNPIPYILYCPVVQLPTLHSHPMLHQYCNCYPIGI